MKETLQSNGAGAGAAADAGPRTQAACAEATLCPACGGANAHDAVFCENTACGKALGPFPYVAEELEERARWHERLADRVSAFIGRPQFLLAHTVWFAAWLAVNTGLVAVVAKFDDYPYDLLALALSVEALFITGFILISQNRQTAHAEKRAELDYEVNVRTYREIGEIKALLGELRERLDAMETTASKVLK